MANKLYPVGIQNFEIIRKEDYLYVDKTAYVYHLTHDNGKSFSWDVRAALESLCWCPRSIVISPVVKTCSKAWP